MAAELGGADPPRRAELGLTAAGSTASPQRVRRSRGVTTASRGADFDRAVALVSAEPSPEVLVARLGLDWDYLAWLALDASAAVLGDPAEQRGVVVSYGGEAFTAGFLIGVHLHERPGRPLRRG